MDESNKLGDESYALKKLIELTIKYETSDSKRVEIIRAFSSNLNCIPGRTLGRLFLAYEMSPDDLKLLQNITNIYA